MLVVILLFVFMMEMISILVVQNTYSRVAVGNSLDAMLWMNRSLKYYHRGI